MRRLGSENGFALVAGLLVMTVIAGLAIALLLVTNSGQKAALREQASESAFNVAEAALNAQVAQLARAWPTGEGESRCTEATTTETNGCPTGKILKESYPNTSPVPCSGKALDSWGSPSTNEWTTYVRDDVEGANAPFNSAVEDSAKNYDANGDGKVWVRSVGVVQCRMVVLAALVSQESIPIPFPKKVVVANWFETRNSGKKVIVNTQGESSQTTNVSVRCSPPPEGQPCEKYEQEKGQVSPGGVVEEAGTSPTKSTSELETLRQQAEATGSYYPAGKCPKGLPTGHLVYIEGPCSVEGGGNEVANSESSPGFLIIANGTLSMGGASKFYGVIYCVDKQNSNKQLIELQGTAKIVGGLDVDGAGGASFNASGENVVYSAKAVEELKTYAGADATRNSFRVLSNSE
jgi:type II secretory pathway pseudopilin PulG